jgi:hypothetical protein
LKPRNSVISSGTSKNALSKFMVLGLRI